MRISLGKISILGNFIGKFPLHQKMQWEADIMNNNSQPDIKEQDDKILSEAKRIIDLVTDEQKPSIFIVSSTIPIDLYSPPSLDIILPKVIRIREKKDKKHLKKIKLLVECKRNWRA
jgi:hypothetical protein